jgi:propanol-preferring alcohol dehydrogenase
VIPGHQIVGEVTRLGAGSSRFERGARVGIAWLRWTCGECAFCRRGQENLCPRSRYTGWTDDGGFAEHAVVDERFAYALPMGLSDEEVSPLLCAGLIGFRALARAEVTSGERLLMVGFGSSAHLTLQVARGLGIDVLVATREARHRALAAELGASWVGETAEVDGLDPVDGAILFAPAGDLVPPMLRALRPGGTLAIAGIHMSSIPPLEYQAHLFHEKRLTSVEANTRADGERLLRLARDLGVRPRVERFRFEDAPRALVALKHDRIAGTAVLTF